MILKEIFSDSKNKLILVLGKLLVLENQYNTGMIILASTSLPFILLILKSALP